MVNFILCTQIKQRNFAKKWYTFCNKILLKTAFYKKEPPTVGWLLQIEIFYYFNFFLIASVSFSKPGFSRRANMFFL